MVKVEVEVDLRVGRGDRTEQMRVVNFKGGTTIDSLPGHSS